MNEKAASNHKPHAVVVGLDCIQGLQSARILAGHGVPVVGISSDGKYYSCRTNVCEEIHVVKTKGPKLIALLEKLGPTFDARPFLLACQDKNVVTISRHREVLEPWYRFVLPDPDVLETLIDKDSFYRFALESGLPLPPTFFVSNKQEAEEAASQLTYPVIIKPPAREGNWTKHTKLKAIVADTREDFLAKYDLYQDWADVLIVQRLVEGSDDNHYTCNIYFDQNREPAVTFTSRKLRQWRPTTGQACLSVECRNDEVVEETMRLFCGVNYRGFAYLEMKYDEQMDQYFIIEPNIGRPTGRAAMAEAAGVDFLYTAYCDAVGLPLPQNRQQTYQGVKWIHLMRDIQAALYHLTRRELTLREWWRSTRGVKAFAVFSRPDPLPFVSAVFQSAFVALSPRERG